MLFFGVLLVVAGACVALPTSEVKFYDLIEAESYFEEFITNFERQYEKAEEKQMRFEIFKEYLYKINELNAQRTEDHNAIHGITQFADRTSEEFQYMLGLRPRDSDIEMETLKSTGKDYPEELDWSKKNKVTSIKDQGHCGSCWAFAGIANIESQYAMKNNTLLDLSPQQILDCDKVEHGCDGSQFLEGALRAAKEEGGVESLIDYPYIADVGKCLLDKNKIKVQVSDYKMIALKNEVADLKQILNGKGPVVIGVCADASWASNTGGIIEGTTNEEPNHVVLIVGYGTENGVPFWIIKNSWGVSVGNKGYYRLKAGENTSNLMNLGVVTAILP